MAFLGVYKAVFDYAPLSEGELQINEGDLLYLLEKSEEDDWWKAKKKASAEDEEEPVGLIPNNYVEEVSAVHVPVVSSQRNLTSDFTGTTDRKSPRTLRIYTTDG